MSLKTKINNIIELLKDSGVEEIEISSFWGAQKIRVSNKSNNVQQVIIPQEQNYIPATEKLSQQESIPEPKQVETPEQKPDITPSTGKTEIVAPLVGTFYSSPKPETPPFIKPGDTVEPGQTICIIEAMKIFNEIESEVSGKIIEILVEDGSPVEYGQVLMTVE